MAIDDIYDEHEQGERVRAWLRQNALGLLGGIGLGLALIFGWQYWQKHLGNKQVEAGNRFQASLVHLQLSFLLKVKRFTLMNWRHGHIIQVTLRLKRVMSRNLSNIYVRFVTCH